MYGLLDCNSFYASCERLFRPDLANQPVVVLSNNDGCVIAMSKEVKALNVKIGSPYFKVRGMLTRAGVAIFSANFELYGDISARVMDCLRAHLDIVEVYSIDEAFFTVPSLAYSDPHTFLENLLTTVVRWCGVPVCIGAGHTRTLAKIANRLAKKDATSGILVLDDPAECREALERTPIEDVWGIGRRLAPSLLQQGIKTAFDFSRLSQASVKSTMGINGLQTLHELNGTPCIFSEVQQARKSIIHSRMFPKRITKLEELVAAIRLFAAKVAERARRNRLHAGAMNVYVVKASKQNDQGYSTSESSTGFLTYPTADSWKIMALAEKLIRKLYQPRRTYIKAGLTLLELNDCRQGTLELEGHKCLNRDLLLRYVDALNLRYGHDTVRFGHTQWQPQRHHVSPRYTTCKEELRRVC